MKKIILTVCLAIVTSVCVFNRGSEAVIYQSGGNYAITIDSFINMLLSYNAHVDTLFNVPALAVWANDDSVLVNNLRKWAESDSVKINNLRLWAGTDSVKINNLRKWAATDSVEINNLRKWAELDSIANNLSRIWANLDSVKVNNLSKWAATDSIKINNLRKAAERDSSNMNTVLNNYHSKSTVKDSLQSNGLYPTYLTKTTVTTKYLGITPVTAMSDTTGWTGIHLFTFTGDTLYIYKANHTVIAK